jgi:hypothetical protein
MKEGKELRMYFFVMYNISEIQKGIQAGHCSHEYSNQFGKTQLYKDWFKNHKTFILLNGGTSNSGLVSKNGRQWYDETMLGTMELYEKYLIDNKIPFAAFREPDLNNSLSSLCFICDEKVFDWETYPPFIKWVSKFYYLSDDEKEMEPPYDESENLNTEFLGWVHIVGGQQNVKLKELIYGKKLA